MKLLLLVVEGTVHREVEVLAEREPRGRGASSFSPSHGSNPGVGWAHTATSKEEDKNSNFSEGSIAANSTTSRLPKLSQEQWNSLLTFLNDQYTTSNPDKLSGKVKH